MDWRRWIASCFGLGWLPVAPGTWGSAFPAGVFALLIGLHAGGPVVAIVMTVLVAAGGLACIALVPSIAASLGKTDPHEVVMDEVAGQALTYLGAAVVLPAHVTGAQVALMTVVGFAFFRVFDIVKPWPIRKLEALPAGWGVLADDLAAGVFAGVLLLLFVKRWVIT